LNLLYLEDDARDIELLRLRCSQNELDCELTAASDRAAFLAGLCSDRFDGIISDSGVHDLAGPDAVRLARSLAPGLPYVFLCGTMDPDKRAEILAAQPDGVFSKDRDEDAGLAIGLLRKIRDYRAASREAEWG
jgi:CheY-like chemotaxis protein